MIDSDQTWNGIPGIAIETDLLRVAIIPAAGAKIHELIHQPSGFDLLWKNPRVPLRATYPGPNFDDVWSGGWDELFPTDAACTVGDSTYHDHGDLWHGPWEWDVVRDDSDAAELHLSRATVAIPCLVEKWIRFERGSSAIEGFGTGSPTSATSRSTSTGACTSRMRSSPTRASTSRPPFSPPSRSSRAEFAASPSNIGWPYHGEIDVGSVQRPDSGLVEWLHPLSLREGWCAVSHPTQRVGLGLEFDRQVFRTTWIWGVYGGWRGHYVVLTEPSTSPPGGLARNVAAGTAAHLPGHGVLETEVRAVVLDHIDPATPSDERPGRWR